MRDVLFCHLSTQFFATYLTILSATYQLKSNNTLTILFTSIAAKQGCLVLVLDTSEAKKFDNLKLSQEAEGIEKINQQSKKNIERAGDLRYNGVADKQSILIESVSISLLLEQIMNISLLSSREAARFSWAALSSAEAASKRLIECSFRAPARYAAVIIPADAWQRMSASVADASYKSLLEAVLDKAAKSILSARIESMSVFPTEIDDAIFSADAILSEAIGGNSEWLSKEELTALWERSVTRTKYVQSARYASDAHYRKAVNTFTDMILKLAGKTTSFTGEECDKILAKLDAADMDTEMGAFIVRRLEQIRNKPQRAEIDLDVL